MNPTVSPLRNLGVRLLRAIMVVSFSGASLAWLSYTFTSDYYVFVTAMTLSVIGLLTTAIVGVFDLG